MGSHEEEAHGVSGLPVSNQLDAMLAEAKIGPELIESLGTGMRSLSDSASKIGDISNATVATNEYVSSVQSASKNVSHLADTYSKAAASISSLAESNDAGHSIGESLNSVSKNLSALNATYELQLQGSRGHLDATEKFYGGLSDLMKNLHDSVEDTKKYRAEMSTLSTNLSALNSIYGNMLGAMNYNK
jgi:gliding motility-associated protein GldL